MSKYSYKSDRITALSDGVFAIAMTLLVFNLSMPDTAKNEEHFEQALKQQLPHLLSWLLSFAIICRLWLTHNRLMSDHPTKSASFTSWNFLLIGAVAFIPFPASLLGEYPDQRWSVLILSASYGIAAIAIAGMWHTALHRENQQLNKARLVSGIMFATALMACLLALVHPYLGIGIWLIYLVCVVPISLLFER